jgi:hypothetical protein
MIKLKGKNKFNLSNQMLLIIAIQIESYVQNLIKIHNSKILFTVEDGIQHLLHGI